MRKRSHDDKTVPISRNGRGLEYAFATQQWTFVCGPRGSDLRSSRPLSSPPPAQCSDYLFIMLQLNSSPHIG